MKFIKIIFFCLLFFASALYSQWVNTGGLVATQSIRTLAVNGSVIFAGSDPNGIFVSTDNGGTWEARNNGLPGGGGLIMSLCVSGSTVYAAVWGNGVYATTNNGTSWAPKGANSYTTRLASINGNLFAGGLYEVSISTNGGTNWSQINNGISLSSLPVTGFAQYNSGIYMSCYSTTGGIYKTTNNGLNWVTKNNGLFQMSVYSLYAGSGFMFAGVATNPTVFKSLDSAENWDASGTGFQPSYSGNSIVSAGSSVIAGTSGGVFYTTNQGSNWYDMSAGLPVNQNISYLLVTGGNIFAAVGTVGVWKRGVNEVGIQNISSQLPDKYSLNQNYPNPFNPVTNIEFSIPVSGAVKLKVFDLLGREVRTIVDENLNAGTYKTDFDASGLNSGVYFYTISAGSFTETRKMILVK